MRTSYRKSTASWSVHKRWGRAAEGQTTGALKAEVTAVAAVAVAVLVLVAVAVLVLVVLVVLVAVVAVVAQDSCCPNR